MPKVNFAPDEVAKEEQQRETKGQALKSEAAKADTEGGIKPERSKKSYSAMLVSSKDDEADRTLGAPKSIHEAAERGNVGYIVRAIERSLDFDINQKDNYGRTALHWAAELGRIQAAEALLDYGIDPSIPEASGRTSVHLAAKSGNPTMLETIMEGVTQEQKEAMVNQPDQFGITPVYLALQKGTKNNKCFEWLMANGGKYNAC